MLVPAMQSIGTFISSSTLSTPTCAPPLAPPPARTRPTRGRGESAAVTAVGPGSAAYAEPMESRQPAMVAASGDHAKGRDMTISRADGRLILAEWFSMATGGVRTNRYVELCRDAE